MRRLTAITLLCASTMATPPEAAETVQIRVVASDNDAVGVRSRILLDDGGGPSEKAQTDRDGRVTLSVASCNDALGVLARPTPIRYRQSARFDCASTLVIPVSRTVIASALDPALADVAAAGPVLTQSDASGGLFDYFRGIFVPMATPPSAPESGSPAAKRALADALDAGRDAEAARAASGMAEAVRATSPELADFYEALAAALAFRAGGIDPGDPDRPLIAGPDGAGTLTPAGRKLVADFQAKIGLPQTGDWSPATLERLPSEG